MFFRYFVLATSLLGAFACSSSSSTSTDPTTDTSDGGSDANVSGDADVNADGGLANAADAATSCNATNCTGCCLNGACQTGLTAAGCGKSGEACTVCSGIQICKADQVCGVDPESMWTVQPASATIATKNGTSDWDLGGGAPDPYVSLWCPPTAVNAVVTPTVNDSFSPTWTTGGCTVKAKDLLTAGFAVQVFDEDISAADAVGTKHAIVPNESELIAGNTNISGAPLTALRIDFKQQ